MRERPEDAQQWASLLWPEEWSESCQRDYFSKHR